MSLFRIEFSLETGECAEIAQKAYRNEAGEVIVVDASDPAPKGFAEFDPLVVA